MGLWDCGAGAGRDRHNPTIASPRIRDVQGRGEISDTGPIRFIYFKGLLIILLTVGDCDAGAGQDLGYGADTLYFILMVY